MSKDYHHGMERVDAWRDRVSKEKKIEMPPDSLFAKYIDTAYKKGLADGRKEKKEVSEDKSICPKCGGKMTCIHADADSEDWNCSKCRLLRVVRDDEEVSESTVGEEFEKEWSKEEVFVQGWNACIKHFNTKIREMEKDSSGESLCSAVGEGQGLWLSEQELDTIHDMWLDYLAYLRIKDRHDDDPDPEYQQVIDKIQKVIFSEKTAPSPDQQQPLVSISDGEFTCSTTQTVNEPLSIPQPEPEKETVGEKERKMVLCPLCKSSLVLRYQEGNCIHFGCIADDCDYKYILGLEKAPPSEPTGEKDHCEHCGNDNWEQEALHPHPVYCGYCGKEKTAPSTVDHSARPEENKTCPDCPYDKCRLNSHTYCIHKPIARPEKEPESSEGEKEIRERIIEKFFSTYRDEMMGCYARDHDEVQLCLDCGYIDGCNTVAEPFNYIEIEKAPPSEPTGEKESVNDLADYLSVVATYLSRETKAPEDVIDAWERIYKFCWKPENHEFSGEARPIKKKRSIPKEE